MNRDALKKSVMSMGGILFLVAVVSFAISKFRHSAPPIDFGKAEALDGRVEVRHLRAEDWKDISEGDIIQTETKLRVLMNASLSLSGHGRSLIIGPDSLIDLTSVDAIPIIKVEAGEVLVGIRSDKTKAIVETEFGSVTAENNSSFIVTHAFGTNFAIVRVLRGVTTVHQKNKIFSVSSESEPAFLSHEETKGIWSISPLPEDIYIGKEGHAAVIFSWKSKAAATHGTILLRNLGTGEMTIHESQTTSAGLTLPSGIYSWSINSDGLVTTSRRFQISGDAPNDVAAKNTLDPTKPTYEPPVSGEETETTQKISQEELDHRADKTFLDENKDKPQSIAPPVVETPKISLTAPAKESKFTVKDVSTERIRWTTSGTVDSIDLDILGSSGNPSMQFTLNGDRTRRRLPELPPGRYTVRIRANAGSGNVKASSPWSETFFDVIQTIPGQLAPTDVKVKVSKYRQKNYLLINWEKSSARHYQVTVQSDQMPATILKSEKAKVATVMPKSGKASVVVCALDANQQVRGCAQEVKVP